MITTGIIIDTNIDSDENHIHNLYDVELPIFRTPGDSNALNYRQLCTCCVPSGTQSPYKKGDKVYVGFVNNELGQGVILGKIYEGLSDDFGTFMHVDSLRVEDSTTLGENTSIGDISYSQLFNLVADRENNKHNLKPYELIMADDNGGLITSGFGVMTSDDSWSITSNDDRLLPTKKAVDNRISEMLENAVPETGEEEEWVFTLDNGLVVRKVMRVR